MGKRKGGQRTQARDFREPRENVWKQAKTEGGEARPTKFDDIVKDNAAFQEYYKARADPSSSPADGGGFISLHQSHSGRQPQGRSLRRSPRSE